MKKKESVTPAGGEDQAGARDAVHAVVTESDGWHAAECLEVAVVTQARSLDALLANLREAVALHVDGEDPARLGLAPAPRLFVSFETARSASDAAAARERRRHQTSRGLSVKPGSTASPDTVSGSSSVSTGCPGR